MRAALAVVALVLFPATAFAQSSDDTRAAATARPAVVLVTVGWHGWVRDTRTGEVFGGRTGYDVAVTCAGTVISADGYVATASHCVHTGPLGGAGALFAAAVAELKKAGRVGDEGKAAAQFADHGVAEGASPDRPLDRDIRVERRDRDGRDVAPATVVDLTAPDAGDVAVLKVERTGLPTVAIRPDAPEVGTEVTVLGHSSTEDLEVDHRGGAIAGRREQNGKPYLEFAGTITRGQSGGPVVDGTGALVGVVGRVSAESHTVAASASTLADLVRGKGIQLVPGPGDLAYRTGVERYFADDYDGAVESFDAALAAGHPRAAEYRESALGRGGAATSPGTLGLLAVLCGCLGLAGLAGAVGMVVERSRAGRKPALVSTVDD
ncbi:serine protease [Actinosynnema sp. NPDC020468]|uniref:S1 family peptidase n=1 Tax=Actinosynnema sp. NPDC020468 TaxID=3154488 RepID=UPI00340FAB85